MGLVTTNWALDFRHFAFHPAMQVLRVCEALRLLCASRFSAMLLSLAPFGSGKAANL